MLVLTSPSVSFCFVGFGFWFVGVGVMLHRCSRLVKDVLRPCKSVRRVSSAASLVNKHHVIPTFRVRDAVGGLNAVFPTLKQKIEASPSFYKSTPLILDFEGHTEEISSPSQLKNVFDDLRQLGIFPVGICNANSHLQVCHSLRSLLSFARDLISEEKKKNTKNSTRIYIVLGR